VSHVLGGDYVVFGEIDDVLSQVSFGPITPWRFDEALPGL
jgi:hypothetical protein